MPELQNRFVDLLSPLIPDVAAVEIEVAPDWLTRPSASELGAAAPTVRAAYQRLTGLSLPDLAPQREHRRVDAVIRYKDGSSRIFEFDERQHFTGARALTLDHYDSVRVAFDVGAWRRRSESLASREPGGGFARPCPPLFPGEGGRHRQRAFRDLLADILPVEHGWLPTARIHDVQARSILGAADPASEALEFWCKITGDSAGP
jgi:hypothetical protein